MEISKGASQLEETNAANVTVATTQSKKKKAKPAYL